MIIRFYGWKTNCHLLNKISWQPRKQCGQLKRVVLIGQIHNKRMGAVVYNLLSVLLSVYQEAELQHLLFSTTFHNSTWIFRYVQGSVFEIPIYLLPPSWPCFFCSENRLSHKTFSIKCKILEDNCVVCQVQEFNTYWHSPLLEESALLQVFPLETTFKM